MGLTPYVDPLPVPSVIHATSGPDKIIEIQMRQSRQKVHRDLPPTLFWGFNGSWPGPTIEVQRGKQTTIKWTNHLPDKHFLPIDHTLHGCEPTIPEVRTVTHVHGACVLPESDGYPEAWYTADGQHGPRFNAEPFVYPNHQQAATLWYHDHCHGITRLNNYAGLSGFYLIRDEIERALNLPSDEFEIPLMLQDRSFNKNGSLLYPKAENGTHPVWVQEFFGDVNCVNGKVMPFLDIEPRKYRFRLLNASNARFYHLRLCNSDRSGNALNASQDVPSFQQIGTDRGLLAAPLEMRDLLIAPGERIDLVLDFKGMEGKYFSMENDAPTPYPMENDEMGPPPTSKVMLFRVVKQLSSKDLSSVPGTLVPITPLIPTAATRERILWISRKERLPDGYMEIGLLGNARWSDPITEDPTAGSTEIWSLVNDTEDTHPIHIHLVGFQVLNRQRFDSPTSKATGKLAVYGPALQPEINESPAWKDTVKTYPSFVTRVIQRFDLPPGTHLPSGKEMHYVWHCHMLEHEDNDMMRPYKVVG
ncbi:MAG TPA: multicopper oxidase [Alloacidobacterium sp.]|nr:multicopper oxidase [Alloacidobacterium sp.]